MVSDSIFPFVNFEIFFPSTGYEIDITLDHPEAQAVAKAANLAEVAAVIGEALGTALSGSDLVGAITAFAVEQAVKQTQADIPGNDKGIGVVIAYQIRSSPIPGVGVSVASRELPGSGKSTKFTRWYSDTGEGFQYSPNGFPTGPWHEEP